MEYIWPNLNQDEARRAEIIGEMEEVGGDISNFDNLTPEGLNLLIAENFVDEDDEFNNSPTIGEYRDFAARFPNENILFHGYAVPLKRDDYRTTIEGLTCDSRDAEFIAAFAQMFNEADEFTCELGEQRCWYD